MSRIKLSKLLKEQQQGAVDYAYFLEQSNGLLTAVEDFEKEIVTALEAAGEETGDPQYQQLQNQVARYLQGAEKQIAAMGKMLDRKQNLASRDTFSADIGDL